MSESRVALITGGGRGIGAAVSLALAGDGMDIAINYRRDEAAARQTAQLVEAMGRRAAVFEASVDDYEADARMVEAVLAEFGHVDVFVHCAGVASRGNTVVDTDPAEVERLLRTHAIGALAISKLVIPSMRNRPHGDVVFLSSAVTRVFSPNSVPYSMAKAAMEALAHTLAKEERANGIHVNIVAPGLVDTDMGRRLMKGAAGIDDIHELDDRYPFGHVCSPEEVADVVTWLVSDGARYVTDQWIGVNGGSF